MSSTNQTGFQQETNRKSEQITHYPPAVAPETNQGYKMKKHSKPNIKSLFIIALTAPLLFACTCRRGVIEDNFTSYDLILHEAHGHVKQIRTLLLEGKDVKKKGDNYVAVKSKQKYYLLAYNFDENGIWTSIYENEKVYLDRDSLGRTVRWFMDEGDTEYAWEDSVVTYSIYDYNNKSIIEYGKNEEMVKKQHCSKTPTRRIHNLFIVIIPSTIT